MTNKLVVRRMRNLLGWKDFYVDWNGNSYRVQAKVFDTGSHFGIGGGRVSKLCVATRGVIIFNYDRGSDLDRAPEGRQLLTSFVGGALKPEAYDWPDGRVWDVVCTELKKVLKLQLQPDPVALFRHRRAIPQYGLKHLRWRSALNDELKRCPGLFITGNYLDGVSVPACMEQADKMAHTVAEYLNKVQPR